MGVHKFTIAHEGQSHCLDYESDEGEDVLKFQLFSLTNVLPENQDLSGLSECVRRPDNLIFQDEHGGVYTLKPLNENKLPAPSVSTISATNAAVLQSDEDLARALQAEMDALFAEEQRQRQGQSHGHQSSRAAFEGRLQAYMQQVKLYEDVVRQNAARDSLPKGELEELSLLALAREGKMVATDSEKEYAFLLQVLFWFKKQFKWVNEPDCDVCGSKSVIIGVGYPTPEERRHGGGRVELFRCKGCSKEIRFPRYEDPLKLLETRSGRCGEWANCFTLYCRALGYPARLILDSTDHVWTECYSSFHNRWIHLDPCEATFDKPLLYEEGWKKKLTYVIALARDGVYDVTKRYTRKWNEVLSRRNEVSESVCQEVVAALTAAARVSIPSHELEIILLRDRQEVEELSALSQISTSTLSLPGRQSGAQEWRLERGEVEAEPRSSPPPTSETKEVRLCVDEHVTDIISALGNLLKSTEASRVVKLWARVFHKLKSQPYKSRKELFGKGAWLKDECSLPLLQAVGLQRNVQETGQVLIQLSGEPIKTSLALPVAIEHLEDLHEELERQGNLDEIRYRFTQWRRLSGGTSWASGEEPPFEISSAAFDGLRATKWHDPNGATGGWIEYRLSSTGNAKTLVGYQIMSANDAPERDPLSWEVDGSNDAGQTWRTLDSQHGQVFERRHMKRYYKVGLENMCHCAVFRFRCLSARDPSSQTRLQLANLDFFTAIGK